MEVTMWGLSRSTTKDHITTKIADILHRDDYLRLWGSFPVNLEVQLFKRTGSGTSYNGGGKFIVALPSVGFRFLQDYGGVRPRNVFLCARKQVFFEESDRTARNDIVRRLERTPYVPPRALAEKRERVSRVEANRVPICGIEFGWECRDQVFSCEWEKALDFESLGSVLGYDGDRREFRLVFGSKLIALRLAQINQASYGMDGPLPVIHFTLDSAPVFEENIAALQPDSSSFTRTRISSLDPRHERVVAYTSLAVRFICDSGDSFETFRALCEAIPFKASPDITYRKEYRHLFSAELEEKFENWLIQFDFEVGFQVEKIVRDTLADFREMLATRGAVEDLLRSKGVKYAVGILRSFHSTLKESARGGYLVDIPALFLKTAREYKPETKTLAEMASGDTFLCYHVSVTPTGMRLCGPSRERSNRVLRKYPDHHSCFIRVTFRDETWLQLRFDREVDGATFVRKRYGEMLRETGLKIAGRRYRFLAYSQSALKEHSVWFMRAFKNENGVLVDPASIIASLGDFDNAPDRTLIRCPGRYGARISQAFTSTDSGVSIEPKEIRVAPDVEVFKVPGSPSSGKWSFTDGVGTISPELADEMWDAIRKGGQGAGSVHTRPRCFQIRFQGCKGMVSVDHRQSGRELVLRPSMIKFQAPAWSEIEIVQAFYCPSPFYLNRPLITVLEALRVPYQVFKDYQDAAVQEAQESRKDFKRAGKLLGLFGLGTSFGLPSIMHHLHKLGVPMQNDVFYEHLMDFSINYVLRELKHHARIPVPGYTFVGVADVHGWLEPNDIFVCITNEETGELEYLEGEMMVTRSPVIHPGDVQIVRAIGSPPPGSPFEKEPLPNAIVFSIKGDRPIPSKSGGGDLDGDIYQIASLDDFPIRHNFAAAAYDDVPKKILGRKCTMDDVADFVTEYINSDVLGLAATNWLIIADQSTVFDGDCMKLSQLHSQAVDYPKTSTPVQLEEIPGLKFKMKPDWSRPETMNDAKSADYYESNKSIGRLFRAIHLPALHVARARCKKSRTVGGRERHNNLLVGIGPRDDDQIDVAVYSRIIRHIDEKVYRDHRSLAVNLFERYTTELKETCAAYAITPHRDAMLTEEEAAVGTIVARTSQPRLRRDAISKLRDQTSLQVKGVRNELVSEEDKLGTKLGKAWALWRVTQGEREAMGARSLGLIALSVIFDALDELESIV